MTDSKSNSESNQVVFTTKCTKKQLWALYMSKTDRSRVVKSKATKAQIIAGLIAIGVDVPTTQVVFTTTHLDLVPVVAYKPRKGCVGKVVIPEKFGKATENQTMEKYLMTLSMTKLISKAKKCKLYVDSKMEKSDLVSGLIWWKAKAGRMVYPLGHSEYRTWLTKEGTAEEIEEFCTRVNCRAQDRTLAELLKCKHYIPKYFKEPIELLDDSGDHPQLSEDEQELILRRANKCMTPRWKHNASELRLAVCIRVGLRKSGRALKQVFEILTNRKDCIKAPRNGNYRTFGVRYPTTIKPSRSVKKENRVMKKAIKKKTRVDFDEFELGDIKEQEVEEVEPVEEQWWFGDVVTEVVQPKARKLKVTKPKKMIVKRKAIAQTTELTLPTGSNFSTQPFADDVEVAVARPLVKPTRAGKAPRKMNVKRPSLKKTEEIIITPGVFVLDDADMKTEEVEEIIITPGEFVLDDEDMKMEMIETVREVESDPESNEVDYPDHSDDDEERKRDPVEQCLEDIVTEVVCRHSFFRLIEQQQSKEKPMGSVHARSVVSNSAGRSKAVRVVKESPSDFGNLNDHVCAELVMDDPEPVIYQSLARRYKCKRVDWAYENTLDQMALLEQSYISTCSDLSMVMDVDPYDEDAIDEAQKKKMLVATTSIQQALNCKPILRLSGGGARQENSKAYGRYTAQMIALGRRSQIRPASAMIGQHNWDILFSDAQRRYNELKGVESRLVYPPGNYYYQVSVVMNGLYINIPVNGPFYLDQPADKVELQSRMYENLQSDVAEQYEGMINRADIVEIMLTEQLGNPELDMLFNRAVALSPFFSSFTQDCMDTETNCVIQMIYNKFSKMASKYRVNNVTVDILTRQFEQVCKNLSAGVTICEMMEWADRYYDNVSMYAVNPFDHMVFRKHCNKGRRVINLTFIQHCNHVYPVTCEAVTKLLRHNEVLPSADVVWQMASASDFLATYGEAVESVRSLERVYDVVVVASGIEMLVNEIVSHHNILIDNIKFNKTKVSAFQHPLTGTVYVQTDTYEERKALCTTLHRSLDLENFRFANQSYAEIVETLWLHIVGIIPESHYSVDAQELCDMWSTAPINEGYMYHDLDVETHAYDATRFYATAAKNNTAAFPVFNAFDSVVRHEGGEIVCGEYLVKEFIFHDVIFKSQIWSWNTVQVLLDMKLITHEDILLERCARSTLSGTIFSDFITRLDELLGEYPKAIINTLIGTLNHKESHFETGMITLSYEEAIAHWADRTARDEECTINTVIHADVTSYHVRSSKNRRLLSDNAPIWRQIISNSHISLINFIKEVSTVGSQVVGVRTDCVYIHRPKAITEERLLELNWHVVPEKTYAPTKNINEADVQVLHRVRDSGATHTLENFDVFVIREVAFPKVYFQCDDIHDHEAEDIYCEFYPNRLANIPMNAHADRELPMPCMDSFTPTNWEVVEDVMAGSMLITGDAGSGKSTLIRELYRDYMALGKVVKCLTFTNVARVNLQQSNQVEMSQDDVLTIDAWFGNDSCSKKFVRAAPDVLIIDEFSQVNKAHMTKLYNLQLKNPDMVLVFAGDIKQCVAVEIGDGIRYNWVINNTFRRMCKNRLLEKPFNPLYGRYPQEYYDVLAEFTLTSRLPAYFMNRPLRSDVELGMCYTNATKLDVIKRKQEQRALQLGVPVSECKWFVGQWISIDCTKIPMKEITRLKACGIFNNARFKIESYTDIVINVIADSDTLQAIKIEYVVPLYCSTVYKNQAITIKDDHVNIYEAERMDKNQMYTALSRVESGEQIHMTYTDKIFVAMAFDNIVDVHARMARTKIVRLDDSTMPKIAMELIDGDIPARVLFTDDKMFKRICNRRNHINKIIVATKEQRTKFTWKITERKGYFRVTVRNMYDGAVKEQKVTFTDATKEDRFAHAQLVREDLLAECRSNEEVKQVVTKTNVKGNVADIQHVPIEPVQYQCNTEYTPAPIERVTSVRGPMANNKWYYKAEPANVMEGVAVKWVVGKEVRSTKQTHFFSKATREEIITTLEMSANEPTYMYEVLNQNVRLFADIDRDIEEEEKFDEQSALNDIIDAVRLVARREGTNLTMDRFRFLSASTATKMSVHMSHLDCIFPCVTAQKEFWTSVANELETNENVWYIKNDKNGSKRECIIDMGVYGKNRAMRTIFSQKPNKNNPLLPIGIDFQQLDGAVVEEYLVSTDSKADYTVLTHDKVEQRRKPKIGNGRAAPKGDIPAAVTTYLQAHPIFGYDCVNVEYFTTGVCRLNRNVPSHCDCCNRTHNGENACLMFNEHTRAVTFKCYRSDITVSLPMY